MSTTTHPFLALKTLGTFVTWKSWRNVWDEAFRINPTLEPWKAEPKTEDFFGFAEFWSSMLHCGFYVPCDNLERVDRLKLYLSLADGWDILSLSRVGSYSIEGGIGIVKEGGIPRYLAERAFTEVCTHVFKIEKGQASDSSVMCFITGNAEALDAVLEFFRIDEHFKLANSGLKRAHYDHRAEVAVAFAKALFQRCWQIEQTARSERIPESQVEMLRERHPRFVDMLYGIGAIELLPVREMGHYRCASCQKRLEEIALGNLYWHSFEGVMGKTHSLKTALFAGSREAELAIIMGIMQEEGDRLEKLQELHSEEIALARKREALEHHS